MAKEITMPKLSDTMTEGLFAGWRKNVGERIERGDIIAEVETDKAVMELEAFASGVLLKTMAKNGELVPVGTVLGLIGEPGELDEQSDALPVSEPETAAASVSAAEPVPPAAPAAPEQPVQPVQPAAPAEPSEPSEPSAPPAESEPSAPPAHNEQDHEKASPMVRRLARDQGVDLGQVQGSGPEGRITQEDLAGFTAQQGLVQAAATAPPPASAVETKQPKSAETTSPQPSGSMRQAIAAAVTHSWQTIPHFSVTMEIDMDACREIVSELKATPHPVGYNALLIKACATALERFPLLRSGDANDDGGIHISIAVALPDGLLMPVIRRCDSLSLAEIERETTRLIDKSRLGRLTSKEMSGSCFSVSNLGMYGVEDFTALIMPGQTAILSVGAVNQRPVVRNGTLAVAATARVTLSSDHRVVDGAYAARFLADLRAILEQPLSMVV